MKIYSITPKITQINNIKNDKNSKIGKFSSSNLTPLDKDTVSFSGSASIAEHLENQIFADSSRLQRIATLYLDVLESVVVKLKDKGFSIDRAYCELNPVKSPKSYVSKVVRSKTLNVPDAIRATVYCNDPYDLSKITEGLLPEMEKRGYVLSTTDMSIKDLIKRGYVPTPEELINPETTFKKIPDIDFRLEDVSPQVTILPEELKYSIGKPQKSGYEDIQMRFIRNYEKKRTPVQHELIILFGPNTAMAKHEESEMVYSHLRNFNELRMKFDDSKIGSIGFKTKRYISMIEEMFRGKVSKKLFENAKNKDYSEIPYEIPIYFNDYDTSLFENAFSSIRKGLRISYNDSKKAAENSLIALKELEKDQRHDMDLIKDIKNKLKRTIEHYNYKNDLKQN